MDTADIPAMHRRPPSPEVMVGSFTGKTCEVTYGKGEKARGIFLGMVEGFIMIQMLDGRRQLFFPGSVAALADTSVQ